MSRAFSGPREGPTAFPPGLRRRLLLRGVVLWAFVRLAAIFVAGVAAGVGIPTSGALEGHPLVLSLLAGSIAWLDLQRRGEVIFYANLGIAQRLLVGLYVLPVMLLEAGLLALV